MENQGVILNNEITFNSAIKNTIGGIGKFFGGLFRLNEKSAAILAGGVILGVLSGIPIIGWGCFLFAVAAGAFAASLFINRSAQPAHYADGLVLGAITGLFGSFIQLFITLVLAILYLLYSSVTSAAQPRDPFGLPNQGFQMLSAFGASGYMILTSLVLFIPIILLAILGGLLGVIWFEKRAG